MTLAAMERSVAQVIDPARYREIMRHHPTGVAAVPLSMQPQEQPTD